jgi:hypothetical protein
MGKSWEELEELQFLREIMGNTAKSCKTQWFVIIVTM